MGRNKMLELRNDDKYTVKIVSDAAMASSKWGDSRLIPVLILDCTNNPTVIDLIKIHKDTPPGDVVSVWSVKPFSTKFAYLKLKFIAPMEVTIVIPFDLSIYPNLIDGIIRNNAVYIQDDKYKSADEKIEKTKLLIEIPSSSTFPKWEKLYLKVIMKKLKNKQKAKEHIKDIRKLWDKRNLL